MRMTLAYLITLLLCCTAHLVSARTISLTFDDGLNPETTPQAAEWNQKILDALRANDIQAMLFPSLRFVGDNAGRKLVEQWSVAGHAIGNHTSKHRSLNNSTRSATEFIADVKEADASFRHLRGWKPMLRFPYLKEGATAEKRDAVRVWLKDNGYVGAPVSIDTSDWYYSEIFEKLGASNSRAKVVALQSAYVAHLLDRAAFYDDLAVKALGYQPPHVMLLHTNAINAATLPELIQKFKDAGWIVVSPSTAFADPLYQRLPMALPAGESIVWAIAKESGIKDLRYPAEDAEYEEPILRKLNLLP